jgi:CDP-diacylglycerol--glycerol-3-phosphate 3-phosphatidyltransferase
MLTGFGFLVSVAAAVVVVWGHFLIGGLLILFSGAFDLFDGALARAKGESSRFGAFLDSTLDRFSETAVLLGILLFYLAQATGWEATWGPILIYLTFAGSILVSYTRARAEGIGVKCEVGIFTRPERVIVLAIGLLVTQLVSQALFITLCILTALAWVTVIQRFIYVWQKTK